MSRAAKEQTSSLRNRRVTFPKNKRLRCLQNRASAISFAGQPSTTFKSPFFGLFVLCGGAERKSECAKKFSMNFCGKLQDNGTNCRPCCDCGVCRCGGRKRRLSGRLRQINLFFGVRRAKTGNNSKKRRRRQCILFTGRRTFSSATIRR